MTRGVAGRWRPKKSTPVFGRRRAAMLDRHMAENGLLASTGGSEAVLPIEVRLARANRRHIGQWVWVAHHMIREGEPPHAYEAMLSAIWLLGVHHDRGA